MIKTFSNILLTDFRDILTEDNIRVLHRNKEIFDRMNIDEIYNGYLGYTIMGNSAYNIFNKALFIYICLYRDKDFCWSVNKDYGRGNRIDINIHWHDKHTNTYYEDILKLSFYTDDEKAYKKIFNKEEIERYCTYPYLNGYGANYFADDINNDYTRAPLYEKNFINNKRRNEIVLNILKYDMSVNPFFRNNVVSTILKNMIQDDNTFEKTFFGMLHGCDKLKEIGEDKFIRTCCN